MLINFKISKLACYIESLKSIFTEFFTVQQNTDVTWDVIYIYPVTHGMSRILLNTWALIAMRLVLA